MLWIKAFHLIFLVTWFAGLFYLPRLFVYHADAGDATSIARFKVMERKLFIIMTIGAIGTAIFGVWLLGFYMNGGGIPAWLHVKLGLVILLIAYHVYLWVLVKRFARDLNRQGHVFYRWINEVPALFLLAIVILAVVKPF